MIYDTLNNLGKYLPVAPGAKNSLRTPRISAVKIDMQTEK